MDQPNELPDAMPSDTPKGVSLGLGRGVNAFFCVVSRWQGVKMCKGCLLGDAPKGASPGLGRRRAWMSLCRFLLCIVWENAMHR